MSVGAQTSRADVATDDRSVSGGSARKGRQFHLEILWCFLGADILIDDPCGQLQIFFVLLYQLVPRKVPKSILNAVNFSVNNVTLFLLTDYNKSFHSYPLMI